jgi:hypothetical protein
MWLPKIWRSLKAEPLSVSWNFIKITEHRRYCDVVHIWESQALCRLEHNWLCFVLVNTTRNQRLTSDQALPLVPDDQRLRQFLILEFQAIWPHYLSLGCSSRSTPAFRTARHNIKGRVTRANLFILIYFNTNSKLQSVKLWITNSIDIHV